MFRTIFFWLEKLKITPAERKMVLILFTIWVILGMVDLLYEPSLSYNSSDYARVEHLFQQQSARIKREQNQLMTRYNPSPKDQSDKEQEKFVAAVVDTVQSKTQKESDTLQHKDKVPPKQTEVSNNEEGSGQKSKSTLIDINKAGMNALESLPGIGPAISERIISYRKQHGPFQSYEDIRNVKGIGEKRLEKMKSFIKLKP